MPRRKPSYPRRTGFQGIREIREDVFQAQIWVKQPSQARRGLRRTFPSLAEARRWRDRIETEKLAALPRLVCGNCGREVAQERPNQRYCSNYCSRQKKLETTRRHDAARHKFHRIEDNIASDGTVFRLRLMSGHTKLISFHQTLEGAREQRDKEIAYRDYQRVKKCPICGKVFRAKRTRAVYCPDRSCGAKARGDGVLVTPTRALPSTRRKWREKQRAELEARRGPLINSLTDKSRKEQS